MSQSRPSSIPTVLFACVHNAGRSQIAAAWFTKLADPKKARAVSAGTQPGSRVHPEVVEAMREVGVDLATAQPQFLSDDVAHSAALLDHGLESRCVHLREVRSPARSDRS